MGRQGIKTQTIHENFLQKMVRSFFDNPGMNALALWLKAGTYLK
jgi:hypothetical protein